MAARKVYFVQITDLLCFPRQTRHNAVNAPSGQPLISIKFGLGTRGREDEKENKKSWRKEHKSKIVVVLTSIFLLNICVYHWVNWSRPPLYTMIKNSVREKIKSIYFCFFSSVVGFRLHFFPSVSFSTHSIIVNLSISCLSSLPLNPSCLSFYLSLHLFRSFGNVILAKTPNFDVSQKNIYLFYFVRMHYVCGRWLY